MGVNHQNKDTKIITHLVVEGHLPTEKSIDGLKLQTNTSHFNCFPSVFSQNL